MEESNLQCGFGDRRYATYLISQRKKYSTQKQKSNPRGSLLRFLVLRALHAVRAEFEKFDLPFDFLLILLAPVVHILAFLTGQFYQSILRHIFEIKIQ